MRERDGLRRETDCEKTLLKGQLKYFLCTVLLGHFLKNLSKDLNWFRAVFWIIGFWFFETQKLQHAWSLTAFGIPVDGDLKEIGRH